MRINNILIIGIVLSVLLVAGCGTKQPEVMKTPTVQEEPIGQPVAPVEPQEETEEVEEGSLLDRIENELENSLPSE